MANIRAERFTQLKAKVKAEMLRRCQSGSVAGYGGTAYDYTAAPAAGKTVRQEHRDKLIAPMRAVNAGAVPSRSGAGVISESDLAVMETKVAAWAARSITDRSGTDCQSGCTGTCYTGCSSGCYGCGSGCPSGCSGCGSGCPSGCSGCGSGCADGCYSGCYGCTGCGSGCPSGCSGCGSGCPTGCSGCGSGCPSSCSSCGGGCSSCSAACSEGCEEDGCDGGCTLSCSWGSNRL